MLDPILPPPTETPHRMRESHAPVSTDLAERMIAFQRRSAGPPRTRDRPERTSERTTQPMAPTASSSRHPQEQQQQQQYSPQQQQQQQQQHPRTVSSPRNQHKRPLGATSPSTQPAVVVYQAGPQPDSDDFSRRLRIGGGDSSRSPRLQAQTSRHQLFDPRTRDEPEVMSDHSGAARSSHARGEPSHRQLFDHRKDDPVRFQVLARPGGGSAAGRGTPQPKGSSDWISTGSQSSYSVASSGFTLSSTTDGSSASGASGLSGGMKSNNARPEDVGGFSDQLKRLYRGIVALEAKLVRDDALESNEDVRVVLRGQESPIDEEAQNERWKKTIFDHKRLAEMMHNLLTISLAPSVPPSLRNIPVKYNIIGRLWTTGFFRLLESLRRAACGTPRDAIAFEHLQDVIYFAYSFYCGLLEEHSLESFKPNWLETLGDLARYRMTVAAMATTIYYPSSGLSMAEIADATEPRSGEPSAQGKAEDDSMSEASLGRIDDSPIPSIGVAAARLLELEPEKERWRKIARDWYSAGVANTPGMGKLHHHLGLLSRELEEEELRGTYYFCKSLTAIHPFQTSRESVLPLWSLPAQARRQAPDARAPELFTLLHGMLFTRVQLDDFNPTLGRFLERLELDGAEEREWTMMAVTNIAAVLEYGKATGVIKKAGGINSRESQHTAGTTKGVRVASRRDGDSSNPNAMDVDTPTVTVTVSDSPQPREAQLSAEEVPLPFTLALELTFAMLSHTLRKPKRKASPYAPSTVNPYPVIILTFLATVLKHGPTRDLLERAVPWKALATFLSAVPRMAMAQTEGGGPLLPLQGAAPLPEDWCLRGMEWVGRRVYPAGFWKAGQSQGQNQSGELEVLDQREPVGPDEDGIIEDDAEDGAGDGRGVSVARWVRLARAGVHISKCVSGLERMDGARTWEVRGQLGEKVAAWAEEDRLERETEEARKRAAAAARTSRKDGDEDWMMVDEDEDAFGYLDDLEDDTEEVRNLKDRLRHLRGQQHNEQAAASAPRPSKGASATGPSLKLVPGYTVLVLDTNVLLASLPMVAALVERHAWTVVVPLPVIMELDGLAQNQHGNGNSALGEAAAAAASYITTAVRSHAISLKVQTSRGNYLPGLAVRAESVEFDAGAGWERSMDDLILRTGVFAEEHWVDRSAMLRSNMGADIVDVKGAEKVVLMTLDRNLRLKARGRKLPAANERDLAAVLAGSV